MRRAAEIGKDLLEKNIQMGSELETLQQEKHEINLKLQVRKLFCISRLNRFSVCRRS